MIKVLPFLLAVVGIASFASEIEDLYSPPYAWVQATSNQKAIVRVITSKTCQEVSTSSLVFRPRQPKKGADMLNVPGNVCELTHGLTSEPQSIKVDGVPLTLPGTQAPKRILLLGDTGCRNWPAGHQDCKNDWPFEDIAKHAAKLEPDLILHVGDFSYRDNCWDGDEGCDKSKVHEALRQWSNWELDFFGPAQTLLAAAPWVFVRGNHEDCAKNDNRGWVGWTQFFSTQPLDEDVACNVPQSKIIEKIAFEDGPARALNIYVLNANVAKAAHKEGLMGLDKQRENWVATHVPFWDVTRASDPFGEKLPNSDLFLSGHVHLFDLRQPEYTGQSSPIQVVQGASGTKRDTDTGAAGTHFHYGYSEDYSVNILERDTPDETYLTLCRHSRSEGLRAHESFKISRGPNGPHVKTADEIRFSACKPPKKAG